MEEPLHGAFPLMQALLDTCALVWAARDLDSLGDEARIIVDDVSNDLLVSSISLWEIALKVEKGKLDLGLPVRDFVGTLREMDNLEMLPVTTEIWLRNVELDWEHRDPADRTIVATAAMHDAPIVTKDERLRDIYPRTIW